MKLHATWIVLVLGITTVVWAGDDKADAKRPKDEASSVEEADKLRRQQEASNLSELARASAQAQVRAQRPDATDADRAKAKRLAAEYNAAFANWQRGIYKGKNFELKVGKSILAPLDVTLSERSSATATRLIAELIALKRLHPDGFSHYGHTHDLDEFLGRATEARDLAQSLSTMPPEQRNAFFKLLSDLETEVAQLQPKRVGPSLTSTPSKTASSWIDVWIRFPSIDPVDARTKWRRVTKDGLDTDTDFHELTSYGGRRNAQRTWNPVDAKWRKDTALLLKQLHDEVRSLREDIASLRALLRSK